MPVILVTWEIITVDGADVATVDQGGQVTIVGDGPVVHILELVLGFRQDGFQLPVLDCDLGLLIPTVIQVCILGQGDIRRDLLALDFPYKKQGDAGYKDGLPTNAGTYDVIVSLPEMQNFEAAVSDPLGGVSTIFSRCKFDLQAVRYRCGVQRARSNQLLLRAVVNRTMSPVKTPVKLQ